MAVPPRPLSRILRAGMFVILALGIDWQSEQCAAADRRDDLEERYLAGLRARRLFALAEQHCLMRLADPALTAEGRVDLTLQLSQCFAEHATYRSGQEQAELWKRARDVVTDLLDAEPEVPGRELLILQSAYVPAAQGTALRWQSELAPYDEALRRRAIVQLESSRDALRHAESTLAAAERAARPGPASSRSQVTLSLARLKPLIVDAKYHYAASSVDLAKLLPGGLDRTSVIHAAEARLNELARSAVNTSRRYEARLLLGVAARLSDDHAEAMTILDALAAPQTPLGIRQQAVAESMRVELARGRPEAALSQLQEAEEVYDKVADEILCVGIEARLAARAVALQQRDVVRAERLWDEASRTGSRIEGPWRVRSQAVLEMARSAGEFGPDLAPLILSAQTAQGNGDAGRAIELFGAAIDKATESDRHDLAAKLRFTRASLLLQSERYADAEAGFLAVVEGEASKGRAAEAHLLAAYCLGKQWEAAPTQANRERYVSILEEHQTKFGDQPTLVEATWMLAAYQESRLQWTEALALYAALPADHQRGPAARARIALLYERILQRLHETEQPREEWEDRAVAQLMEYIDLMPLPPAPLSVNDAQVILSFGRIVLDHRAPDYDDADALLDRVTTSARLIRRQAAVQDPATFDGAWPHLEQTAERLRIVSLAGQGRIADARKLLGTLTAGDAQAALTVLDGLSEISGDARPRRRTTLGELQLLAAEEVQRRRAELTPSGEQRLDRCLAQAYAAVGRPNDSARAYRRMLQRAPDDQDVLVRAAVGIAGIGTPRALREAKTLWRRLEALEKPGSQAWLSARLEVVRCSWKLGEFEECRKLLGVTRVLYPALGGPMLKKQFDELESAVKD